MGDKLGEIRTPATDGGGGGGGDGAGSGESPNTKLKVWRKL